MSEEIKHRPAMTGSAPTSGFRLARLADAIDLLEADVAAIQAKVGQAAQEDVRHLRAEVERLKAELTARPAVNYPGISDPAAPPGWLTDEEVAQLWFTLDRMRRLGYVPAAEAVEAILARAGSPPVVEVPAMESLGDAACHQARAYRAALDKAGVPWKEVGRE